MPVFVYVPDFKSDTALLYKVDNEHQLRLYVMASEKALGPEAGKACIHDLESGKRNYVGMDEKALAVGNRGRVSAEHSGDLQGRFPAGKPQGSVRGM
jgi:hypothetical protein